MKTTVFSIIFNCQYLICGFFLLRFMGILWKYRRVLLCRVFLPNIQGISLHNYCILQVPFPCRRFGNGAPFLIPQFQIHSILKSSDAFDKFKIFTFYLLQGSIAGTSWYYAQASSSFWIPQIYYSLNLTMMICLLNVKKWRK